jgi:molecular chaperone DnaK
MINSPRLFADMHRFEELSKIGMQLMRSDDIDKLRQVVAQLYQIMVRSEGEDDMFEVTNIIKG